MFKFIAHGKPVLRIAQKFGWRAGARYTNIRDVRGLAFENHGFLDIDWKKYNFSKHLDATKKLKPFMTVARDVEDAGQLDNILREAEQLAEYSSRVLIVPKDTRLAGLFSTLIPKEYLLGYSVPTKYGGTQILPHYFDRPVHLLGGRPDVQRRLGDQMNVFSIDCNRFTIDASFGDYFNGVKFVPHPIGGYKQCIMDSIANIDALWSGYSSQG